MSKSLKESLKESFPNLKEEDFSTHYSDLYVVNYPGISNWLKNNKIGFSFFESQQGSNWNGAGKKCIDIPFKNDDFWKEKLK